MTNEGLKEFSPLDIARKTLQEKRQAFGGTNGTSVTITDIADLITAHLAVTRLERGIPLEQGQLTTLDFMRINPLQGLSLDKIDFTNPAVLSYAREFLYAESVRLNLLKVSLEIDLDANIGEEGPILDAGRQMKARQLGVEIIDQKLLDSLG